MRFLNKGVKGPTGSILEVGVPAAMDDVYWVRSSWTVSSAFVVSLRLQHMLGDMSAPEDPCLFSGAEMLADDNFIDRMTRRL